MSIKPETLENPERDLSLLSRDEPKSSRKREDQIAAELKALKDRIAAAKGSKPRDSQPHCGDCYRRGWAAAIEAIEGG